MHGAARFSSVLRCHQGRSASIKSKTFLALKQAPYTPLLDTKSAPHDFKRKNKSKMPSERKRVLECLQKEKQYRKITFRAVPAHLHVFLPLLYFSNEKRCVRAKPIKSGRGLGGHGGVRDPSWNSRKASKKKHSLSIQSLTHAPKISQKPAKYYRKSLPEIVQKGHQHLPNACQAHSK